jgi:hypothetical protein
VRRSKSVLNHSSASTNPKSETEIGAGQTAPLKTAPAANAKETKPNSPKLAFGEIHL